MRQSRWALLITAAAFSGACAGGEGRPSTEAVPWSLDRGVAEIGDGIPFCDAAMANVAEFMGRFEGQLPPDDRYGGVAVVGSIGELTDGMNGHVSVPKLGLTRHLYVAPTDEQAATECRAAFQAWFHNINFLWNKAGSDFLSFVRDFDGLFAQQIVIAGSPETVREQVQRAVDETGINYFCSIFAWGDFTPEQVMRSVQLFADEVMPNIKPYAEA